MANDRRSLISHNGKFVIFLDHSNLSGPEYVQVVEESAKTAEKHDNSNRLILVDSTNSIMDKDVLKALKKLTSKSGSRIDKTAVLGISGIQQMFLRTISAFSKIKIRPFDSRDKALEWLTGD